MLHGLRRPVCFLFLFFISSLLAGLLPAQTREIDSLRNQLKSSRRDTVMVANMKLLGYDFYSRENYDSAEKYEREALSLCDFLRFRRGMTGAYEVMGLIALDKGEYSLALQSILKSYGIAKEFNYQKGISHSTNDLGLVYYSIGDYATALNYFFISLKIKEINHDSLAIEAAYNNIVDVYKEEKNIDEAKTYLFKELAVSTNIKDSLYMGYAYVSFGELYLRLNKLDSALYCANKAKKISKGTKNEITLATSISYLGSILFRQGKYRDAFLTYKSALKIADSINEKEIISMICNYLGDVNVKLDMFPEAKRYYDTALSIALKINDKKKIMQCYLALTSYDSASGNHDSVLGHYKLYVAYRDSMFNINNARKIENEKISYEFAQQSAIAKEESERKIQRQRMLRNVFIGGFGLALLFSLVFFFQRVKIGKEKKRSDDLLLNILPAETAEELKSSGSTRARNYDMVTVLFTDFKNFTKASENLTAQELVNEINYCYSEFDRIVTYFGIEKIKTIGDGYMAAGGLPVENKTNAVDTVKAALAIRNFIEEEKIKRQAAGKSFFEIRIGVHTGPVVAGVVGIKKFAYDIWGDTVNIASRMESSAEPGKVNISGATYELVKDQFKCTYRGKIQAKNKGEIDMYFIEGW